MAIENVEVVNSIIKGFMECDDHFESDMISDGKHNFYVLYYQRMVLLSILANKCPRYAWKADKSEYFEIPENHFLVGFTGTELGAYFVIHDEDWDYFSNVKRLETSPEITDLMYENMYRLNLLIGGGNERIIVGNQEISLSEEYKNGEKYTIMKWRNLNDKE